MSAMSEIQDADVKGTDLGTDPEAGFKQTAVHLEGNQSATPGHAVEFTGRQFGTVRALDEQGKHILIPQPSDVSTLGALRCNVLACSLSFFFSLPTILLISLIDTSNTLLASHVLPSCVATSLVQVPVSLSCSKPSSGSVRHLLLPISPRPHTYGDSFLPQFFHYQAELFRDVL
jgi:hypothetical protein